MLIPKDLNIKIIMVINLRCLFLHVPNITYTVAHLGRVSCSALANTENILNKNELKQN